MKRSTKLFSVGFLSLTSTYFYLKFKKVFFVNYVTGGEYHYLLDDNLHKRQHLKVKTALKIYENNEKCLYIIDNNELYFGKLSKNKVYYCNYFENDEKNFCDECYPIVCKTSNVIYAREKENNKIFDINYYIIENDGEIKKVPRFFKNKKCIKIYTAKEIKDRIGIKEVKFYDDSIIWTDLNGNFFTDKIII